MSGLLRVRVEYYPETNKVPAVFLAGGLELEAMYQRFGKDVLSDSKQQHTAAAHVAYLSGKRAGEITEPFDEWRQTVAFASIDEEPGESEEPPAP